MIQSAAPITIGTAGITQDLTALFPNLARWAEMKIINAAPNPLQVSTGSDTHWIDSWSADVLCVRANTVTFTPIALGRSTSMVPSPRLLISVAETAGEIPGTYPVVVDRSPYISLPTSIIEYNVIGLNANVYTGALLAPVAGSQYWLFTVAQSTSPANAGVEVRTGTLGDDAHTTGVALFSSSTMVANPFNGVPLGLGNGVWFKNVSGAGLNLYGYATYTTTTS